MSHLNISTAVFNLIYIKGHRKKSNISNFLFLFVK